MTWNYRVIKEVVEGFSGEAVDAYGVHEVYYDSEGNPSLCSGAVHPFGETPEELKRDLEAMMRAFERPILDIDSFKSKEANSDG